MKPVVQVKLLPTPEQAAALAATLPLCNSAANEVSAVAFEKGVFARQKLQKLVYYAQAWSLVWDWCSVHNRATVPGRK